MDQLRRETQPPAGMLPSPVPQYWHPDTEQYERVLGAHGAPRATLYGPNGQPISSSNPLETRVQGTVTAAIRDSNGNPITAQNRLPVDVGGQIHADVDLGDVTVQIGEVQQGKRSQNAEPWEVSLSGRSVQPRLRVITETPLAAGTGFTAPVLDLEQEPGVGLVSYMVECDTVTRLSFGASDGSNTREVALVAIHPSGVGRIIPRFAPLGRRWSVHVFNPTNTNQSVLRVYELQYADAMAPPQNLRCVLAQGLEIRDTSSHNRFTDPQFVYLVRRIAFGGGKLPIYVQNGMDQAVQVSISLSVADVMTAVLGTTEVPAASNRVITNQDFPGLDVPSEEISLSFRCQVAPSSGSVNAYADILVGGST